MSHPNLVLDLFLKKKRGFFLVLFFPVPLNQTGSEIVTKIHYDQNGKISCCYHQTYHVQVNIENFRDCSDVALAVLNHGERTTEFYLMMPEITNGYHPPLCVDYYEYVENGKSIQLGSATLFCKSKMYDLIDFPLMAKNGFGYTSCDNYHLNVKNFKRGAVRFNSNLLPSPTEPRITLKKLQVEFDKLIEEKYSYSKTELTNSEVVNKISNTPMFMTTRVCARVSIKNFLKYFPIPMLLPPLLVKKLKATNSIDGLSEEIKTDKDQLNELLPGLMPALRSAPQDTLKLEEFGPLCINWIKEQKGYTDDKHIQPVTGEEIKTDYWISMLLQDVGNCKNMGITLYQLCMCYYKDVKIDWTFHLCSLILKDNNVPHAVCVALNKEKVFILDATRDSFEFDHNLKYLNSEYFYFVTLFSLDGVFNMVRGKTHLPGTSTIGITPEEFMSGDYHLMDKKKPEENEELIKIAYAYQNNILA